MLMFQQGLRAASAPEYHDGMLIFKMRTDSPMGVMAMAAPALVDGAASPGLAALADLERAGLVKNVTALAEPGAAAAPMGMAGMMGPLAAAAAIAPADSPSAGVSLVELTNDSHVEALRTALASDPSVEAVSRVPVRYLFARRRAAPAPANLGIGIQAVPPALAALWNLSRISWEAARALAGFKDAMDIKVAVLDTGVDADHPDLQGQIASYTFAHPDLPGVSSNLDLIGHGTHVAGTIAALNNNAFGINGICQTQLHCWKIFDDQPDFNARDNAYVYFVDPAMYRRALNDCLQQGIDVINLSIGGTGMPDFLEAKLFRDLLNRGTTVVAAMGNARQLGSPTSFPAAIPGVIAIGATGIDDKVAGFSNAGNHIALCAPGVGIWSTLPTYPGQFGFTNSGTPIAPKVGNPVSREVDYDSWQGTSMATPHVAAAAALLLANRGAMSGADVRQQLMATCDKVPSMNLAAPDPDYGAGRLNLLRLLS
jgi:subtilisin family serine protease